MLGKPRRSWSCELAEALGGGGDPLVGGGERHPDVLRAQGRQSEVADSNPVRRTLTDPPTTYRTPVAGPLPRATFESKNLDEAGDPKAYLRQQQLFTQELPVLPLFQRVDVTMTTPTLEGVQPDPTAPFTWNIASWRRKS